MLRIVIRLYYNFFLLLLALPKPWSLNNSKVSGNMYLLWKWKVLYFVNILFVSNLQCLIVTCTKIAKFKWEEERMSLCLDYCSLQPHVCQEADMYPAAWCSLISLTCSKYLHIPGMLVTLINKWPAHNTEKWDTNSTLYIIWMLTFRLI